MIRFVFLILFIPGLVQAQLLNGHDRGNGGNIVSCPGRTDGFVFLDYYVGVRFYKSPEVSLAPQNGSDLEKVANILDRLSQRRPQLAESLRSHLNKFYDEVYFVKALPARVVSDYGAPIEAVLAGCSLLQLVVQTTKDGQNVYVIDQKWWWKLSEEQRAYAILHEILLKEYRQQRGVVNDTSVVGLMVISLTQGYGDVFYL